MSEGLSKKQQKAQAFRAKQKQKAKGLPEPEDVPEADLEADEDVVVIAPASTSTAADKGKKRKRPEDDKEDKAEGEGVQDAKAKAKAVEKGKGKAKTAWDEDEEGTDGKKGKKEIKQRFILFIGNLGYKTTREDIQSHFKEAAGRIPAVRLLTEKSTGKGPAKSRGIAFLELATSAEMQACLRLHESMLNFRKINVELTAGGGGKSEARKSKIQERNTRVGGQRERREKREREAAGEPEPEPAPERGPRGGGEDEEGAADGYKMRNDRRVKVKSGDDRPAKRARQDGGAGWGNRGGPPGRGGGGGRKWEPTGANAVVVGK